MSSERRNEIGMTTALAEYTVVEVVHEDGSVEIEFSTTNPPKGLDGNLYGWYGSAKALTEERCS